MFGVGIYHSGVEIEGTEYAYGGNTLIKATGVYENYPKQHSAFDYKLTLEMGELSSDAFFMGKAQRHAAIRFDRDIWPILEMLMDKYRAFKYDMLTNNCNHFTDEFIRILTNNRRSLPGWVNRAAWLGSWFHCFVPVRFVTVCPEGQEVEGLMNVKLWLEEEK